MGVEPEARRPYFDPRRAQNEWTETTTTTTYKLKDRKMIGKFIVDEDGRILVIDEIGSNPEYVFAKEYDVKGGAQVMLPLCELTPSSEVHWFDSVMDAQKYVEDNFDDVDVPEGESNG